ncbi:MAG: hypothetical protein U0103_13690 [Candidatus Obscuribacterales bacterium]
MQLGQPFTLTPLSSLSMHGPDPAETGSAQAMFNMMRNLGGSAGTALASTIAPPAYTHPSELASTSISEPVVRQWLLQAAQGLHHAGATTWTSYQQALQVLSQKIRLEAYVMAFNDAFAFVAIVIAVGILMTFLLKKVEGELHAAAE